eukprot:48169-Chlamydomonas_euryale.AAC.9
MSIPTSKWSGRRLAMVAPLEGCAKEVYLRPGRPFTLGQAVPPSAATINAQTLTRGSFVHVCTQKLAEEAVCAPYRRGACGHPCHTLSPSLPRAATADGAAGATADTTRPEQPARRLGRTRRSQRLQSASTRCDVGATRPLRRTSPPHLANAA